MPDVLFQFHLNHFDTAATLSRCFSWTSTEFYPFHVLAAPYSFAAIFVFLHLKSAPSSWSYPFNSYFYVCFAWYFFWSDACSLCEPFFVIRPNSRSEQSGASCDGVRSSCASRDEQPSYLSLHVSSLFSSRICSF